MKSRVLRVLVAVLAVAALAASGAAVWHLDRRIEAERSASDSFERDARQVASGVGELRAAQMALVAQGQPADPWLARTTALAESVGPKLSALRGAAATVEGQGALESAIEAFTTFGQRDARARDYLRSGQVLSASDVVFADAAPLLERVVGGLDTARAQESIARAITVADARKWELIALASGLVLALAALLALVPLPRSAAVGVDNEAGEARGTSGGLGLSPSADSIDRRAVAPAEPPEGQRASGPASIAGNPPAAEALPGRPDLAAIADVCSCLARVQFSSELPGLLERTAKALDSTGVIVWMPDAASGMLRPALSHGYTPAALARMGGIQPAADNATAAAYRTKTVVAVPPDAIAGGAVVAPLHTAEGCSGVLAVELADGVTPTPQVRAGAAIVAAQLATLLTPTTASGPDAAATPQGAAPGGGTSSRLE